MPFRSPVTEDQTWCRYLFASPKFLRFEESGRQQLDSASFISETSIDQLHVLISGKEAVTDGHAGARHHMVLD